MAAKLLDQANTIKAELKKHGDELAAKIVAALRNYRDEVGEYPDDVQVDCSTVGEGDPLVAIGHDILMDVD